MPLTYKDLSAKRVGESAAHGQVDKRAPLGDGSAIEGSLPWTIVRYEVDEFILDACAWTFRQGDQSGLSYWNGVGPHEADFYGLTDKAEAREKALYGWSEGLAMIERLKAQIDARIGKVSYSFQPTYAVTGAVPDIGLFLEGIPECMIDFSETESREPGYVHVHITTSVSAAITVESINLQGAAIGALVDALESRNHRVKLTWERSSYDEEGITLWMVLKDYSEPLQLDRLAFFLCNPAARRVMAWNCYMAQGLGDKLGVYPGNASCNPCTSQVLFQDADIRLDHVNLSTLDKAQAWIIGQLAKRGIKLEGQL